MTPGRRWKAWLLGYAVIGIAFGLAWWNNPANIGGEREAQRVWLALLFSVPGLAILLPPLVLRRQNEGTAQTTLIIVLALYLAVVVWWVGYLPSDPYGCSRVDAPDCHTNPMTRWRAFTEVSVAWIVAFVITATVGSVIARRREAQSLALSGS
jgi:4-hydroxybenzoate polyprenyltransferase